ncbi:MAG: type II toxin-antitoxin system HicB family antitoxin [Muribaculaceae bacterium]|nr:type II toxin-antitoxin system HicB family antitoxin [Muribaculaceae bacterium]
MNTMKYKGYVGSIEVSEEDNCLYGKVLALPHDTMITYQGETVTELREDFYGAVDDYLAYCKSEGIEPRKSYTGNLNIRLSPDTHSKIASLAKQAGISISAFIRNAVEKQIAGMI